MDRVIITGADGFVGSNTTTYFVSRGKTVLAIDRGERPRRLPKHELLTYRRLDAMSGEKLIAGIEHNYYDTFIHFAWAGSAGPERMDYYLQMQNAISTVEVMKAAKELGCNRFVCAGSIMEREIAATVKTQGSRPSMAYIYGIGKLLAHALCKSVAAQIGIELVWPMITNAYGVGEYSPRFVNTTIRKIINNEPLKFTSGTQNYDFVYITDVARAFYMIAEKGRPFCEYIVGSSAAKPLREFILEMMSSLSPDHVPVFGDVPFTGTNMPLSAFDTIETERDTGFRAAVSFKEGTRRTMQWMKGD